ncbi:hypothetical protein [Desulfovibrio inopinatus]|uniref:hypothetical protein n=1 Tax=Desulfovibrio inopinatus TaxID=102109 RepID=UPI0012EBB4A9|nr:hypothetical protein [Desulfovibrio inopinatus]
MQPRPLSITLKKARALGIQPSMQRAQIQPGLQRQIILPKLIPTKLQLPQIHKMINVRVALRILPLGAGGAHGLQPWPVLRRALFLILFAAST